MSKFTEKTESFLSSYLGNMTQSLAGAVIQRFGGEESFIEQHTNAGLVISEGLEGWVQTVGLIDFYQDNKEEILAHATLESQRFGHESLAHLVVGFSSLEGKHSIDEINNALHNPDNEHYEPIAVALAWFSGETLSHAYGLFLNDLCLVHAHAINNTESEIVLPDFLS